MILPASVLVVLALRNGGFDLATTNLLGLVAWLGVLGAIAFARPPRRAAWIVGGSIFAFMACVGLSMLWSESAERSFAEFNQVSTYLALFVGTVLTAQRLGVARIVEALTLGLGVIVALALLSRLEPSLFPEQTLPQVVPDAKPRLSYPLNYWNGVALSVALAVPLLLHQATRPNVSRGWRAAGVALLPISGLVLYFTFSRGGLVCSLLAAAVVFAFTRERLQTAMALAIGAAGAAVLVVVARSYRELNDGAIDTAAGRSQGDKVLLLALAVTAAVFVAARAAQRVRIRRAQLPPRRARLILAGAAALVLALGLAVVASADLGSRLETLSSDSTAVQGSSVESRFLSRSGNGRTDYWSSAIDAWEANPVEGTGSGTWSLWWQRRPTVANFVRDPHSMFFEVAGELGTIGVLALLAMFGSILWAGWRAVRAAPRNPAAPALLALAVAFTVNVAIDWTWELSALGAVFFIAAGLLVSGSPPTRREDEPSATDPAKPAARPARRQPRLGRGMVVALVAWAAVFAQAVPLVAEWQVDRSQDAVRRDDLKAAEDAAETARSIMPWAAAPNLQLAQTLEVSRKYEGALKYAADAVRQEPTNWQTWLVLARIESRRGNSEQARRYLVKSRSLNPGSTFWLRLGFQP